MRQMEGKKVRQQCLDLILHDEWLQSFRDLEASASSFDRMGRCRLKRTKGSLTRRVTRELQGKLTYNGRIPSGRGLQWHSPPGQFGRFPL